MAKNCVIIVAAGKGQRMKGTQPKQFISVADVPVLVHSIRAFLAFDPGIRIILVLGPSHQAEWNEIKKKYLADTPVITTEGGATRFESVSNGLKRTGDSKWVAVHDAVRPCVDIATIKRTFVSAQKHGSGIPVVPMKDSIRRVSDTGSNSEDRNHFVLVQTPQTFGAEDLLRAYSFGEVADFTDDASVYEAIGNQVHLVDGNYQNVKVTTEEDLFVVEQFLKKMP